MSQTNFRVWVWFGLNFKKCYNFFIFFSKFKEQCAAQDSCQFWTFREGWARDCYLKRGRRGDPTYTNAVPKVGYVSGTKGDICSCLANSANSDEEVCPISYSR
jgi:hypothetical protein